MKKFIPQGTNIIVLPLPKEPRSTESGLHIVDNVLAKAKVMEVGTELSEIYKKGDIVIYPENVGIFQYYKQQECLWLNGKGYPEGNVIAIIKEYE